MSETPTNLAEALPREQQRVRGLIEFYRSIGPAGAFGVAMMQASLAAADRAAASGDVVAMLAAYQDLKEYEE